MKRVLNTYVSLCTCVLGVWLPSVGGAQTTYPAPACDLGKITERVGGYQFDSDLDAKFANHPDWQDHPTPGVINDASFYQRNGRLEFEVLSASQAASEAWKMWRVQLSSERTWKIAADVVVPLSWNHGSSDEHQIGAGLVVGKPGGDTVYEIDFLARADNSRGINAQNIENRHGGDPNYVVTLLPTDTKAIRMEVMYCNDDKSLSIYYDGNNRVDTQPIDAKGLFDWQIGPVFDVGIIGFSEGPAATSDFIYVDNWEVYQ